MCCYPDKYGRPSCFCLLPLALLCIILGGGLVGTWVACYYECLRGKEVEYNYYAAVWTGGLAVFSGVFQLFLVCVWNKCLKYFLVIYNVVLVLCCLLSTALYSYVTYLENKAVPAGGQSPSIGVIITALQAVLAAFILFFLMIWSCIIGCASLDDSSESYDDDRRATRRSRSNRRTRDTRGPYDDGFFNREPGIYSQQSQYQERPQEVSYGQPDPDRTNTASGYIIPRASVRGTPKEDSRGYRSNGGAMIVDGREPRSFYSGSSRMIQEPTRNQNGYTHQNGHAQQNGSAGLHNGNYSLGRARDFDPRSRDLSNDRFGRGVSLMEMHGVAPTANNITEGYY